MEDTIFTLLADTIIRKGVEIISTPLRVIPIELRNLLHH
nr:MAG TPA: hypothetical protein [Caudoviricetes sp.]